MTGSCLRRALITFLLTLGAAGCGPEKAGARAAMMGVGGADRRRYHLAGHAAAEVAVPHPVDAPHAAFAQRPLEDVTAGHRVARQLDRRRRQRRGLDIEHPSIVATSSPPAGEARVGAG